MSPNTKRDARAVAATAAVAAGVLLLVSCSGSGTASSSRTTGPATTSGSTPTGSVATSSTTTSASGTTTSNGTVTASARPTRRAVPLTSVATFSKGVTVDVVRQRSVTVTGRGVGELSGPAVAFTLRLRNGTTRAFPIGNSVVACSYGANRTPCSDSSASPAKAWRGTLGAGRSADGTYVFLVPKSNRDSIQLQVSYDPTQPVVILRTAR